MSSVESKKVKTLDQIRKEAKLYKSDVYKSVGVDAATYDNWANGRTLPDISKAVALAKTLKTPLVNIFAALGVDIDCEIVEESENSDKIQINDATPSHEAMELIGVLKSLPDDKAAIVISWIVGNKKDGGSLPPSRMPS